MQKATIHFIEKVIHFKDEGDSVQRNLMLSNTFKYKFEFDLNIDKIKGKPVDNRYYSIKDFKNINNKDFL